MFNKLLVLSMAVSLSLAAALKNLALAADPSPKDKPTVAEIHKAQKQVKDYLAKLKIAGPPGLQAAPVHIADDALTQVFPKHLFFSVVYRQFPVGIAPPAPLKTSNVFAVPREAKGKLELLADTQALQAFFKSNLMPIDSDDRAKNAVRSWLHLASVFSQDGFFQFVLQDDSTKVVAAAPRKKASGKMVVMAGGNGTVEATLSFDDAGKLADVAHQVNIRAGIRPICQATKLLDADPVVRQMAEQHLLIMGTAAQEYLAEQRGKADAELRMAIDRIWERILKEKR